MTADGTGVLLKLGGELVETAAGRRDIARAMETYQPIPGLL